MQRSWSDVVAAKRAQRDALMYSHRITESGPALDTAITDITDVSELRHLLQTRQVSAEDVVHAYINK